MTVDGDLSVGLVEAAELIYWQVGVWHDLGYENPPTPECKPIPPLGERSASAIKGGQDAVGAIDVLLRQLYRLREQLIGELRQDEDIRGERIDRMLAELRERRSQEAAASRVDQAPAEPDREAGQ